MTPKISVIIPSFNKAKYIRKTLDSIFTQTYSNIEVIIQDGGSTDGTLKIIEAYHRKFPRLIKWRSGKDDGQLDAVNRGLKKATGDILTFINADDLYTKNAFQEVSKAHDKHPDKFWFCGRGVVIDRNGYEIAKTFTLYKDFLFRVNRAEFLLITNYLIQPSVFFTRQAYKKYGPFTGTNEFIMEYGLWLKLASHAMPVKIDKVLSKFRIDSGTKTKRLFTKILKEDEKIVSRYTANFVILLLHKLNNLGRIIVVRFI